MLVVAPRSCIDAPMRLRRPISEPRASRRWSCLLAIVLVASVPLLRSEVSAQPSAESGPDPRDLRRRIRRGRDSPEAEHARGALDQAETALRRERSLRRRDRTAARRALSIAAAALRLAERKIARARAESALALARRREEDAAQRVLSARTASADAAEAATAAEGAAEEETP